MRYGFLAIADFCHGNISARCRGVLVAALVTWLDEGFDHGACSLCDRGRTSVRPGVFLQSWGGLAG